MFFKIIALSDSQETKLSEYRKYWREQMVNLQLIMGYGDETQKSLIEEIKNIFVRNIGLEEFQKLDEKLMPCLRDLLANQSGGGLDQ